ncbi:Hypothetical predicted protein [Olea europaea subsp. europaea]|uniref:Cytochrome c oxidase subunit 3 n=1 Tax=Olea europaea subsp. europaea TaxID=158383 RepID=A0A8S0V879_OLEEU|nr:Hypothetical predicted protein [Olea europaea subsp. europaea]
MGELAGEGSLGALATTVGGVIGYVLFCIFSGFFSFFFGTYGRDRRAAVTWAHHAIPAGKEKLAVYTLVATVLLALVFTGFQGMEYYQASSTISDSIYGSTFFLATGFHGFHVIICTLFLIICGIRQYLGHLTKEHHVGFEAAAWYWHFVDVVRLFPFVSIYWVAGSPRRGRSDAEGPEKCSNPVADPLVGDGDKEFSGPSWQ